jgi:hypothetical protein
MASLDVFGQLLPASWRGVPFPVVDFDSQWSHDRAAHKVYKKAVSNVETTGRNSREFSFDIPFHNGVVPGTSEDGLRGRILFPDLYLSFIDAFNEPTTGELVHPIHGKINCKPGTIRVLGRGNERSGVNVHATFDETDDDPEGNGPAPDSPAPITGIASDAEALDAMLGELSPPLTDDDGNTFPSFSELGAALRAPFDTLSILQARMLSPIVSISDQLDRLKESVDRQNDVGMWPIVNAIGALRESLFQLATNEEQVVKILRYIPHQRTTVAQIVAILHVDFDQLVQMNPMITDTPFVEEGTIVYYKR